MEKTRKYIVISIGVLAIILILTVALMTLFDGGGTASIGIGAAAVAAAAAASRRRKEVMEEVSSAESFLERSEGKLDETLQGAEDQMRHNEQVIPKLPDVEKIRLGNDLLGPDKEDPNA